MILAVSARDLPWFSNWSMACDSFLGCRTTAVPLEMYTSSRRTCNFTVTKRALAPLSFSIWLSMFVRDLTELTRLVSGKAWATAAPRTSQRTSKSPGLRQICRSPEGAYWPVLALVDTVGPLALDGCWRPSRLGSARCVGAANSLNQADLKRR